MKELQGLYLHVGLLLKMLAHQGGLGSCLPIRCCPRLQWQLAKQQQLTGLLGFLMLSTHLHMHPLPPQLMVAVNLYMEPYMMKARHDLTVFEKCLFVGLEVSYVLCSAQPCHTVHCTFSSTWAQESWFCSQPSMARQQHVSMTGILSAPPFLLAHLLCSSRCRTITSCRTSCTWLQA
jgi:hypothetical protein